MAEKQTPDKKNLYRLPWSANDNPIGWVEITDICNIHCDGCYRMIMGEGHKPLEQIKEEILFLKKWRNCDGISIAGGEPLTHPNIVEIVQFITDNKLKSMILTNGYALNEEILLKLKKAGVTGLSFHIDSTQIRPEFQKIKPEHEKDMHDLRLKYARMLKKVGGYYAHFGITVSRKNLHEVPDIIQWAIDNMDVVGGISLIIYRGVLAHEGIEYEAPAGRKVPVLPGSLGYSIAPEELENANVTSKEVYGVLKEHFPSYEATGYLGGTVDHTSLKWLIGNLITDNKGKVFGAYGKKTIELVQTFYHYKFGKYLVYPKVKMGRKIFFMGLFDKTVRKAFATYLDYCFRNPLRFFNPMRAIGIGIVQAPDVLPDGRIDMCDDCPDMCVFEGKLVNSCRLDECRKFGGLLHLNVISKEAKEMLKEYRQEMVLDEEAIKT
jgi:sulfatase maturation enzyme AslB (radical SAM superfamily)